MSTAPSHFLPHAYEIELFDDETGLTVARRPVPETLFELCRQSLRFAAERRGQSAAEVVRDVPQFAGDSVGQIAGFTMSLGDGTGQVERQYPLRVFQTVADDILAALIEGGQVTSGRRVNYRAYAQLAAHEKAANGVKARVRRAPLPLLAGHTDRWLDGATHVGPEHDDDYPIFLTAGALPTSVEKSWAGPNLEGGAWLIGNLYRQSDPPEIFALLHTVLEARGMAHGKDSLDFSNETWLHLQEQLERRKTRFGKQGEVAAGFIHSHPFLPAETHNQKTCTTCEKRATCTLSSAFLSKRDAQFHTAVFGAAAYAVQMVLGLTPLGDFDLRMFALDGCRFRERGFYVLADEPAAVVQ